MDIPVTAAKARLTERARRALIASIQAAAKHRIKPGPTAARSQDFLFDDRGLPRPGRVPRYAAGAATRDEDGTKAPSP